MNYLSIIGRLSLLSELFGEVLIPPAVATELSHAAAPSSSRELSTQPPPWLSIRQPQTVTVGLIRATGVKLGSGEIEAIALAMDLRADPLLIDERPATFEARSRRHLHVTGLLGVLRLAAVRGLVDLAASVEQFEGTGFKLPKETVARLLQEDADRKRERGPLPPI